MNRQAFPSILLSVAIVCFFAVALYRRDPHPPVVDRTAERPKVKATTDRVAVRKIGEADRRPITTPPAPARVRLDSAAGIHPAGSRSAPRKVASAVARGTERGPRVVVQASKPRKAAATEPRSSSTTRAPRPALTVARAGETITDVARRVYGRDFDGQALWRANRDVVHDLETAIPAGTVLRTPAPPSR